MTALSIYTAKLAQALKTSFSDAQKTLIEYTLIECEVRGVTDPRWLAYILATNWHECRFKPIRETDWKGEGITDAQAYARVTAYCKKKGKKNYAARHPVTKQSYYGRSGPQLTHYDNYKTMETITGLPLTTHPDLVLQPEVAAKVTVAGMTLGTFCRDKQGKPHTLARYFNAKLDDPLGARRIVNGTDSAALIQGYYAVILPLVKTVDNTKAPSKGKPAASAGAVVAGGVAAEAARQHGIDWRIIAGILLCTAVIAAVIYISHRMTKGQGNG